MDGVTRVDVRRYRDALKDASALPIACRGVLFVLAQYMNGDGSNGRPGHDTLATGCGITERQLARHLSTAISAGYLRRVSTGHNGRAAVYEAIIPTAVAGQQRPPTRSSSQTSTSPNNASSRTSPPELPDISGRVAGHPCHPTSYDLEKQPAARTTPDNTTDLNKLLGSLAPGRSLTDIAADLRAAGINSVGGYARTTTPTALRARARQGYLTRTSNNTPWDIALLADDPTPYDTHEQT